MDPLLTSEADPVHQDLGVIPGGIVDQEHISMGHFLERPRYGTGMFQKHCSADDEF